MNDKVPTCRRANRPRPSQGIIDTEYRRLDLARAARVDMISAPAGEAADVHADASNPAKMQADGNGDENFLT